MVQEYVTLHANEYVFTCPNCQTVNARPDVISPVMCENCRKSYPIEDVYHTCATPYMDERFQNSQKGMGEYNRTQNNSWICTNQDCLHTNHFDLDNTPRQVTCEKCGKISSIAFVYLNYTGE